MKNPYIRKANTKDVLELQKISKKTFLETYASGNTEENMNRYLQMEFSLQNLKLELKRQNSEFYFAYHGPTIIGYLKVNLGKSQTEMPQDNSLEIQRIYVLSEFQGKKVGKALYEKAMQIGKENKVDFLWLGVWEENPKAIEFYKKVGFYSFGQHTFVLGDDAQTDIMMKKEVS